MKKKIKILNMLKHDDFEQPAGNSFIKKKNGKIIKLSQNFKHYSLMHASLLYLLIL